MFILLLLLAGLFFLFSAFSFGAIYALPVGFVLFIAALAVEFHAPIRLWLVVVVLGILAWLMLLAVNMGMFSPA